ncbi:uroporphyrinogen-III synthase [Jinshanibacter sp. LJY008]|uniref:Uroporphyrinogen-III synthase n=1 Tax=Limnobaculum eriocheiris TaxID=2897391 RepID=A0A9X1MWP2_9GAMM|nr:uroporphyrinogen-III synthase [Limnobaculum eriocheiris]MCD1126008.1 uroporphyrinogen-III synthase [Limnobaculum eriocheiris]
MTILVTRPTPAGDELVKQLIALGFNAYHTPLISFAPGDELNSLPNNLNMLRQGDLLIAASQHAVYYARDTLLKENHAWPDNIDYLAIGEKTARELEKVTNYPVARPEGREISEQLLKLPQLQHVAGKRVLILRGNGGRPFLAEQLKKRGAEVTFCECYQRHPIPYDGEKLCHHWQQMHVNTLVITSGEMLQQLYELVPERYRNWLLSCQLLVVSERLAALASTLGWMHCQIADNADNDALLRALQQI